MSQKQTYDELLQHLKEQVGFLAESCTAFDSGNRNEYKRMTAPLRVILHDKGRQVSLLSHLGVKNRILFYDTARDLAQRSILPRFGLVMMKIIKGTSSLYEAPLDMARSGIQSDRRIPFDTWWTKIIFTFDKYTMTRAELVLTVAEKDGGVHVDQDLGSAYHLLTRLNGLGWRSTSEGVELYMPLVDGPQPPPPPSIQYFGEVLGPESSSIRQIAHETVKTLKAEFPNLF